MSYLDFELEIGIGQGREYPVTVVRSASGEARETMRFPFDKLALENQLLALENALLRSGSKRRQILVPEEQTVRNFGQVLFNALFTGEVRSLYAVSQLTASNQGKGLRLKLRILPPELAALPWEFLYDAGQAEYICLSSNTPIVRYLELPHPPSPLTVTPPLSILCMTASPKGLANLDVEREKQRVEKATKQLCAGGLVKLTWIAGSTWQDLQRAMRRGPWHIFHFIGHGGFDSLSEEGTVALENEEGVAHILSATHLGRLLADHRSLRLVILNSCEGARGSERDIFSSTAAVLVRRGIPAVLAMQYEITDQAAIEFSRTFYEALADGLPVDAAVSDARKSVSVGIENTVEWGTPVLYLRSTDGVLFDLVQQMPQPQKQPDPMPSSPQEIGPTATCPFCGTELSTTGIFCSNCGQRLSQASHLQQPSPSPLSADTSTRDNTPPSSVFEPMTPEKEIPSSPILSAASREVDTVVEMQSEQTVMPPPVEPVLINKMEKFTLMRTLSVGGLWANYIRCVAISPDGQTLVSASDDKKIRVWDLHIERLLGTLIGHSTSLFTYINSLAISHDGQTLVSSSDDKTIKVWNLPRQELVGTLTGHSDEIHSVAISPDGQTLVSGSKDQTIKVWNLPRQELVGTLTGHSGRVSSVAISPDGQTLVSGSADQTIKVWNLPRRELIGTLTGHSTSLLMAHKSSLAISPDGQMLVSSGSADQAIKVWDLPGQELVGTLTGHSGGVSSLAISPDGQTLVSGSADQTIKVWDLPGQELIETLTGHSGGVYSVAISPDGQTLASGSADQTIKIWSMI